MNFDQARAAAIQGDWVRHDAMQPGSHISYHLGDGLRINFPSGSSSGWTPRDSDREATWEVCGPETERPKTTMLDVQKIGRALRPIDPAVGWGNPLPRSAVTPIIKEASIQDPETGNWQTVDLDSCVTSEQAAMRAAMPKIADVLVEMPDGSWQRATADLPPGHYTAKIDPLANVGKWGKPVEPVKDVWGRPLTKPAD